ncbi:RlpA-like double-psi beta-barrel domain-containing protein [Kibdelosporangium philippinense]|uniref:RlpA-like double-psi beta-barrel domain-containing protein n=1 Tax=Kibdelosporangium philippinense TaxID=211113 RepID=A0ABS8ZEU5_9PSEU|nr:RlpA-like double-psi beta-barrel domain-containing protein [Kibdelosporangium philippinense]MCE7006336.1 RlpA-like double-psi beta-barrel domain-containing protein [Kibdelosporangium philippinense]
MKLRKSLGVVAVAAQLPPTLAGNAYAGITFNQTKNGTATRHKDGARGACGSEIDASSQMLVAAAAAYWTTTNPDNDPLCSGVSIQVTYKGKRSPYRFGTNARPAIRTTSI